MSVRSGESECECVCNRGIGEGCNSRGKSKREVIRCACILKIQNLVIIFIINNRSNLEMW
jgi:hypothetical protein